MAPFLLFLLKKFHLESSSSSENTALPHGWKKTNKRIENPRNFVFEKYKNSHHWNQARWWSPLLTAHKTLMITSTLSVLGQHTCLKKIYYMYWSLWFSWKCIDLDDFQRWSSIKCPTCLLIATKVLKASFHFNYWTAILLFFLLCDWEIRKDFRAVRKEKSSTRHMAVGGLSWVWCLPSFSFTASSFASSLSHKWGSHTLLSW